MSVNLLHSTETFFKILNLIWLLLQNSFNTFLDLMDSDSGSYQILDYIFVMLFYCYF